MPPPSVPSTHQTTPLDQWHRSHGGVMVPFAGYEMPIRYGSIVAEHQACRSACALFDVSHMGRIRFDGDGAEKLIDHLLTRRIVDLPVGGVRYGLVCNADGGILDDVLVSHLETPSSRRYHLMVVNASNREKILQWILPHLADFPTVTVSDRTELTAMIAVQGPKAVDVCARLFSFDPRKLKYYRAKIGEQFGKPVIISRTGYTGEDGLELIVRAEDATRVWENLLLVGRNDGFVAAGLGARDTLRMEAAMPLYGQELDETINPIEAGLSFACDLDNRSFVGDEALRAIASGSASAGNRRMRIGLLPEGKRPARQGATILDHTGQPVGTVTSGVPAPTLGRPIAMGYVSMTGDNRPADASDDSPADHRSLQGSDTYSIDIRGKTIPAIPTELPFYSRKR